MEVITPLSSLRKLQGAIPSQRLKFSNFLIFEQKVTQIGDFFEQKLKNLKISVSDLELHPVAFGELGVVLELSFPTI